MAPPGGCFLRTAAAAVASRLVAPRSAASWQEARTSGRAATGAWRGGSWGATRRGGAAGPPGPTPGRWRPAAAGTRPPWGAALETKMIPNSPHCNTQSIGYYFAFSILYESCWILHNERQNQRVNLPL